MWLSQQNGLNSPGMVDRDMRWARMADAYHLAPQSPAWVTRGWKAHD